MNKLIKAAALVLTAALMLASCGADNGAAGGAKAKERKAVESAEIQFTAPKSGDTIATIDTSMGVIKAVLYPEYAPQAVENFTGLAEQGYYNGLIFHRVVSDFVIQSGDDTGTGAGGKTIWDDNPFAVEVSDKLHHYSGALGVARVGNDLNSCKSQFYVVQAPQNSVDKDTQKAMTEAGFSEDVVNAYAKAGGTPSLDGSYTVFGQVFEGMDVVDAIGGAETKSDKPVTDIVINSITISTYQ